MTANVLKRTQYVKSCMVVLDYLTYFTNILTWNGLHDNYSIITPKIIIELQNTTQKTGNIFVPLPWKQNFNLFPSLCLNAKGGLNGVNVFLKGFVDFCNGSV
jgi:hypothetical protein